MNLKDLPQPPFPLLWVDVPHPRLLGLLGCTTRRRRAHRCRPGTHRSPRALYNIGKSLIHRGNQSRPMVQNGRSQQQHRGSIPGHGPWPSILPQFLQSSRCTPRQGRRGKSAMTEGIVWSSSRVVSQSEASREVQGGVLWTRGVKPIRSEQL